jgi:hypothetical protein
VVSLIALVRVLICLLLGCGFDRCPIVLERVLICLITLARALISLIATAIALVGLKEMAVAGFSLKTSVAWVSLINMASAWINLICGLPRCTPSDGVPDRSLIPEPDNFVFSLPSAACEIRLISRQGQR